LFEGDVRLPKLFRQTVPQHWPGDSKTAVTELVAWSLDQAMGWLHTERVEGITDWCRADLQETNSCAWNANKWNQTKKHQTPTGVETKINNDDDDRKRYSDMTWKQWLMPSW